MAKKEKAEKEELEEEKSEEEVPSLDPERFTK